MHADRYMQNDVLLPNTYVGNRSMSYSYLDEVGDKHQQYLL